MEILKSTTIYDEKCSYLENRLQTTTYQIIDECTVEHCYSLIERGWRRFGSMFFRPICPHCNACESVKIDVPNYTFSKSERRILRKNQDLNVRMMRPLLSQAHLELHELYHRHMQEKKGWDHTPTTAQHYYASFIQGHENFGFEIQYRDGNRLVGVDIIDILPSGVSSTYFFYDPAYEKRSLGKLSLLVQIQLAKERSLPWIYLGYYVQACDSLNYKATYLPQHVLQGRPNMHEIPEWKPIQN